MPDRTYQIIFTSDTTQVLAGIRAVQTEFAALDNRINGLNGPMQNITAGLNNITAGANAAGQALNQTAQSGRSMIGDMAKMHGINMIFDAAGQAVLAFGDVTNKTRERIKELAIDTMDLRDKMRELANLQNESGPNNIVAGEAVKMGMQAGMMPKEMTKYLEQFEGSIPAGEQLGHIDAKTKKELAIEGAKFGSRVALAPETAGDLAGVVSQYTDLTKDKDGKAVPQEKRTERAMTQMGRVVYGLNMGLGKLETLTRSLINTAGAVVDAKGNPIEDLGDLAAIQGVASTHANPRESGTRVRQAVRALRDTKGESGSFLVNTAKIKDTDSHVERLQKVKDVLEKGKKNGKAADTQMRAFGFTDEDEIRAIIEQTNDLDLIKQRIKEGREQDTGKAEMQKDEHFLTKERVGIRRKQMATKAGREFLLGEQNERYQMAMENAEQQMIDDKQLGGSKNNARDTILDGLGAFTALGLQSNKEKWKSQRAEQNLRKEADRLGIDVKEQDRLLGRKKQTGYMVAGEEEKRTESERIAGFNKLADEVERKGGNATGPQANLVPKFDQLIQETRETNRILKNRAAGNNAPAAPAAPPIPPMRGPAAPARP